METTKVGVEQLANYDIFVLADRSGSMTITDMPNGRSRWKAAEEGTIAVAAKAMQYDQDGITVGLFGGSHISLVDNVKDTAAIQKIFKENEPNSGTPTDQILKQVLDKYFAAKAAGSNPKPILIAVITDGEPNDRTATKKVIVEATQKMDKDEEVAISFLQIGNDASATSFLAELDDELVAKMGAKFDIVDTKKLEDIENITETLLAAIND